MTKEERVNKTAHLIVDRWLYNPQHSRYQEAMHIIGGWLTTFAAEVEEAQFASHGPCHGPEDCPREELEEKLCRMRDLLKGCNVFLCDSDYGEDPQHTQLIEDVGKALFSAPQCPHKEEAEKLRQEIAAGYGCKLCHCCGEKSHGELEEQLAALQAALDGANGRILEIEFLSDHVFDYHFGGCLKCENRHNDERHSWKRERWTEEAKKQREARLAWTKP